MQENTDVNAVCSHQRLLLAVDMAMWSLLCNRVYSKDG